MGWNQSATRIEELREMTGRDPRGTLAEIEAALEAQPSPTYRASLYGLKSACLRHLGQNEASAEALDIGDGLRRVGPLARADLSNHRSSLLSLQEDWTGAIEAANKALSLLPPEKPVKTIKTAWGRRQQRTRQARAAAAYMHRGQARLGTGGTGDIQRAHQDATKALEIAPTLRTRQAAVTLLAHAIIKGGGVDDLRRAGQLLEKTAKDIPRSDLIATAQVRWCRALILARFGSLEQAESFLTKSIDTFRDLGAVTEYRNATKALVWLIRDRQGNPDRARFMAKKLHDEAP